MWSRIAVPLLLLLGCTAPEQPLGLRASPTPEWVALHYVYVTVPDEAEPPPMPPDLEPPRADPAPTGRARMWRILEDADAWIEADTGLEPCASGLPRFPAISGDGRVLALALVSAPVADETAVAIRLYRVEDGALLRNHTLLGPLEAQRLHERRPLARHYYCQRATRLSRALASDGYEPMPVVGRWDNPVRDGLPDAVTGWLRVVSDGATLDVDMAVADIVLASSRLDDAKLKVRDGDPQRCRSGRGQFSSVWSAADVRVFRRGPCGC